MTRKRGFGLSKLWIWHEKCNICYRYCQCLFVHNNIKNLFNMLSIRTPFKRVTKFGIFQTYLVCLEVFPNPEDIYKESSHHLYYEQIMLIIVSKHYYQTHDKWPLIYPNATANPYTCIFNNHLPYFLYFCKLLTLNLTSGITHLT